MTTSTFLNKEVGKIFHVQLDGKKITFVIKEFGQIKYYFPIGVT